MADHELASVVSAIRELDATGTRFSLVLRQTLDQLYDGQHTGRYRWDQLHKTEKTHCGTLVEINLHRAFRFDDGEKMDYRIAGVDVDCKYSQSLGGWMIPQEAMGHLCLLVWSEDQASKWSVGIVRIQADLLTQGGNRDGKRSITAAGRKRIVWIFQNEPLPQNILLQLPRDLVDGIMGLPSGQKRVDAIFRVAQRTKIWRGVIATLAIQEDYMKRVRYNGGSRGNLQSEGIIILGQYKEHAQFAKSLGVPVPGKGEFVSVRVAPADAPGQGVLELEEGRWRVAEDADPATEAPRLPKASSKL